MKAVGYIPFLGWMEAKYTMQTEMLAIYKIVTQCIYEGSYFTTGINCSVGMNDPREEDTGVEMRNHSIDRRETYFLWGFLMKQTPYCALHPLKSVAYINIQIRLKRENKYGI